MSRICLHVLALGVVAWLTMTTTSRADCPPTSGNWSGTYDCSDDLTIDAGDGGPGGTAGAGGAVILRGELIDMPSAGGVQVIETRGGNGGEIGRSIW